ncbi:MAG TPA: hypothetical protein PKY81_06050 [bacterium]|nr:hypothetical protein [bacterium]HPN30502.1 hypothetical protein [bacterium]
MKHIRIIAFLSAVIFLFAGCAGLNQGSLGKIPNSQFVQKDFNAEVIESAAREAASQIVTVPLLKQDKKYIVMSLEDVERTDCPLNSLIEDAIISSLTKSGFSVYERDKDVLTRLAYQEGGEKLKSFTLPPAGEPEKTKSELPKYDVDYGKKMQIVPAKVNQDLGTGAIETSDFVISYRILESGVKYYKIAERDESGAYQIKRAALVKLSVRITDSKTAKIIWGDVLSGLIEDLVPRSQVKYLEKTGYDFYQYTLPLQKK